MVEEMEGLVDGVIGFSVTGKLKAEDYEQLIIPTVEAALATRDKVSLLCELDDGFEGMELKAAWDDAKLGLLHPFSWSKIALVTNITWVRTTVRSLGFLMPAQVRLFDADELSAARDWVSS